MKLQTKTNKMKATYNQIEKALDNSFEIGVDGSQDMYEAIRLYCYEAIEKAGIQKTQEYFTKADWKAVYKNIKKLIA
jgi:hypothetical protein